MKKIAVIDIESNSFKVLFAHIGKEIIIEDFFEETLPREVKNIEDKNIFIKEKISDVFPSTFPTKNIIILAKGTDVVIRNYTFPVLSKANLYDAVKWKIIEHSHLQEQDVIFNYRFIRDKYRYNTKFNVTAVATSRSVIRKYHDYFSFTNHKAPPVSFEAEGIRGLLLSQKDALNTEKTLAVMHIGTSFTNVVILKENRLMASRMIPTADENFSRVLVGETIVDGKTVTVSREEADIIKKDIGIPLEQNETSAYAKLLPPAVIYQMLQPLLEGFVSEIERFFKFYTTQAEADIIDEILLVGPGTNLKNIDSFFHNKLRLPTSIIKVDIDKSFSMQFKDPSKTSYFRQNIKSFSTLIGICSSVKCGDIPLKIYDPPGILDKIALTLKKIYTVFIGLVFLIGYIIILSNSIKIQKEANYLEKQWTDLITAYHNFFSLHGEQTNITMTLSAFNDMKKTENIPWLAVFREISIHTPDNLALETLKVEGIILADGREDKRIKLKGFVIDDNGRQEETITQFIISLNHSDYFRKVDIKYTEKDDIKTNKTHFEVLASINIPETK